MSEKPTNRKSPAPRKPRTGAVSESRAGLAELAASKEALEATLEGLEQLRRGDAVRVTRKTPSHLAATS